MVAAALEQLGGWTPSFSDPFQGWRVTFLDEQQQFEELYEPEP
jgi:hypothetical protein